MAASENSNYGGDSSPMAVVYMIDVGLSIKTVDKEEILSKSQTNDLQVVKVVRGSFSVLLFITATIYNKKISCKIKLE